MSDHKRTVLRQALGALFVAASVIQGTNREFFEALVPKSLAKNGSQVQGAMTAALAGLGVSFLIPKLRLVARWAATAFLVGSLPAAVDQVKNPPKALKKSSIPPAAIVGRIPMQVLVIVASWIATRKPGKN